MDRFEEAKLRVKESNDLVALIEQYQPLKQRGRTLVALCPFHPENSPSFTVFRETQHFRCFGCGKTGDVFTWLMERDGLSFREAMETLAERAGVSLEGVFQRGRSDQQKQQARTAYEALAQVADYFHRALVTPEGKLARDYLDARGLGEAIVPWTLGYHPTGPNGPGNGLQSFAREHRLPLQVLEQAGLLRNGREIYAGRLMFPILDERGRTVAFGGRLVPGAPGSEPRPGSDYKPPKYLNSPESPFFSKRRVLYGLRAAKNAGERRLVVMEGYTDVIACHLSGFPGAVASLGTAFTADHARIVERFADQGVVLMFDGDRAGRQAAERAHRELVNSRLSVRVAMVSDGSEDAKDPADVVLARPGEDEEIVGERRARFADTVDGAEDAMSVWFRLMRQRLDFSQPAEFEKAAQECARLLEQVEQPVRQVAIMREMARHLEVPEAGLKRLMRKAPASPRRAEGPEVDERAAPDLDEVLIPDLPDDLPSVAGGGAAPGASTGKMRVAEAELLACVLAQPDLLVELDFDDAPLQVAEVQALMDWAAEGQAIGRTAGPDLFRYLFSRAAEQPPLQAVLALAQERAAKMVDPREVLRGILDGRRRVTSKGTLRELREQLSRALRAGDSEAAARLQAQVMDMMRRDRPLGATAEAVDPVRAARPRPSFLDPQRSPAPGGAAPSVPPDSPDRAPASGAASASPAPEDPSVDESA
ncbi:MAG: DNA primase [Planctomycetota bacterium]